MAINFGSLMLNPSPVVQLDFARGFRPQGGDTAVQREQLKLMREKFTEEKRQYEATETRLREEAAARAAQTAAANEQAQLEKRQTGIQKFTEAAGSGDIEAAEAMIPWLNSLGSGVDITQRPGGLPSYRVHFDAAADAAKETAETDRNLLAAKRPIYEYPYQDEMEENPLPDVKPTTPTGTVLDIQALQGQRLARLNPALEQYVLAHPDDYRDYARAAAAGAAKLGLPVDKAVTEFRQQLSGPIELVKSQLEHEAKKTEKDDLTEVQKSGLRKTGASFLRQSYNDQGIDAAVNTIDLADRVVAALTDPNPAVQTQAGQLLVQLGQVKGVPSDKELGLALGDERLSVFDQVAALITRGLEGGFGATQKEGLIKWAKMQKEKERGRFYTWLDSTDRTAASKGNEFEREGMREFRSTLPVGLLRDYEEWRKKQPGGKSEGRGATDPERLASDEDDDFDVFLEAEALDSGLDPEKIRRIIGPESGGKAEAVSSEGARGILQIMPDNLRAMGIDPDEYGKLSRTEQLPAVMQFLKAQGLTEDSPPEHYAMAVAASDPKYRDAPDDTVIYPKGSKGWKANKPWRPADDGDITRGSILKFYGLRGGGESAPKSTLGVTSVGSVPSGVDRARQLLEKAKR